MHDSTSSRWAMAQEKSAKSVTRTILSYSIDSDPDCDKEANDV
jgi:hypothetical protein